MADPLTQAVNEVSPARTNYLDPAPGRDVIARYGQARMESKGLEDVYRLGSAGSRFQMNQMREQRMEESMPFLRKQQEFQMNELDQKQVELDQQREIQMMEDDMAKSLWSLDDGIESVSDYNSRINEIMQGVPAQVQEQPWFQQGLRYHQSRLRDMEIRERSRATAERQADNMVQRAMEEAGEAGVPLADIDSVRQRFLAGEMDEAEFGYEVARLVGNTERARKSQADAEFPSVNVDDIRERDKDLAMNSLKVDTGAFPRQLDLLREEAWSKVEDADTLPPEKFDEKAKKLFPQRWREAERFDNSFEENHLEVARRFDDPQDYIDNGPPNMTPEQKEKRLRVWRYANDAYGTETRSAPSDTPVEAESVEAESGEAQSGEAESGEASLAEFEDKQEIGGNTYVKLGGGWFQIED